MMRLTIGAALLLTCGLVALACDEKKPETSSDAATSATAALTASAAASAASTAAAAGSGTAAAATASGETEQDFEDEAQAAINEDNLDSEITKMEQELK